MTEGRPSRFFVPERLFTLPVFLISLLWMCLMHFLDIENNAGIAPLYQRFLVLLTVHLIPFAFAAVVLVAWSRRLPGRIPAMIFAVVTASALRGFAQFQGLNFISARPLHDELFRVAASLTNTSFAIVIAWAGSSAVELHRRRRERLLDDRQRLLLLRHQARTKLEQLDAETSEQIRTALLQNLNERNVGTDSEKLISQMRSLIDDVVRPLSRYFEQQSDDWLPPEPPKQLLKINWREVLRDALNAEKIHPVFIMMMIVWTSWPNTLHNRGFLIMLVSVSHALLFGLPLFVFIRRVGMRLSRFGTVTQRAMIFFAALFIGGEALGLTSWFYTRFKEPHFTYIALGPAYTLLGGTLIAVAQSTMNQSRAMEASLEEIGDELRWSLARAREMHRQQRRALAHALHGRVQAALASAVLRLEMLASSEVNDAAISAVFDDLKQTISTVDLLAESVDSLDVVMERVKSTWAGLVDIELSADAKVLARLSSDATAAIAVNDLLTELTYNSVKHGSATEILISISCDERQLCLDLQDNGKQLTQDQHRGLGSSLLDDCAISWSRSRTGERTRTSLLLPVQ